MAKNKLPKKNQLVKVLGGQPYVIAEENVIETINAISPDENKNVTITGSDIDWNDEEDGTIQEKFEALDAAVENIASGETEIVFNESNITQIMNEVTNIVEGTIDDLVKTAINNIITKLERCKLKGEDDLLVWDEYGLASKKLTLNFADGELILKSGNEGIANTPLALGSIEYTAILDWNGSSWNPNPGLSGLSNGTEKGPYLVVGYKNSDTNGVVYSKASLKGLVDIYTAGPGLSVENNEFSVKIENGGLLTIGVNGGIKLNAFTVKTIPGNGDADGLYFVIED